MKEAEPVTRPRPVHRPIRFLSKPIEVSALLHDGSEAHTTSIRDWVAQVAGPFRVASLEQDLIILDSGSDEPHVRVQPGEYLVLTRTEAGRTWTSWPPARFLQAYQAVPREMPIFDDGEVA